MIKRIMAGLILLMISYVAVADENICDQYPSDPICKTGGPIGGGGHGGAGGGSGGSCGGGR